MQELDNSMFFPSVIQAVPTDDYKVYAYFNDGSIHCIDVKPLIRPGTVFEPLSDISFFKEKLTVINNTVAWDIGGCRNESACVDLDPEPIFNTPQIDETVVLKHIGK